MSDDETRELHDRNLVPADEQDHLNVLRYFPRDPPVVAIFDDPLRCYKANKEWAIHIMGAVQGLAAWKAWTGEEDELNDAVQSIMEFMVGEVCAMFLLRQNPTNHCLLEQSIDGGDTWTTAFDFGLCGGGGSQSAISIYIDVAITNINTLLLAYVDAGQDITIMYPNVEYDSGPDDEYRDTALCYSIEALTEGIYNAAEAVIAQEVSRNGFMSQLISGLTGGFWASDTSLLNALAQSVTNAIFGTDELEAALDALGNTEARRSVVCCIYENMQGQTPTQALWETAGDNCDFTAGSDMALLLAVLEPIFAGLDAYLSWVTLVSDGFDMAENGIIGNDCIECAGWIADRLDGDGHDDLTIVLHNPVTSCLATWSGTVLLGCETGPNGSASAACEVDITGAVITKATLSIHAWKTRVSGTPDDTVIEIDGVEFARFERVGIGEYSTTLDTGQIAEEGAILRFDGFSRTNTIADPGMFEMTQIHVEGRGTNPFT